MLLATTVWISLKSNKLPIVVSFFGADAMWNYMRTFAVFRRTSETIRRRQEHKAVWLNRKDDDAMENDCFLNFILKRLIRQRCVRPSIAMTHAQKRTCWSNTATNQVLLSVGEWTKYYRTFSQTRREYIRLKTTACRGKNEIIIIVSS